VTHFVSGAQNIGFLKSIFPSLTKSPIVIPSFGNSSPIKDFINKNPIGRLFLNTGNHENPSFASFFAIFKLIFFSSLIDLMSLLSIIMSLISLSKVNAPFAI